MILCFGAMLMAGCGGNMTSDVAVGTLRCEYLENPLGIDVVQPRLSWMLASDTRGQKQTAYQITVAGSRDALDDGAADIWDSGKVNSDQSVNVPYSGIPLASRMECWWRVRVWDMNGELSEWSEPAMWTMGLLDPADWRADWIGGDWTGDPFPAMPWMRKNVELTGKPDRATAYVCALGYYELYINGEKVDDHVLSPAVSDFSKRYYYITHDVTNYLREGANIIALWLGRGWYVLGNPGVIHTGPLAKAVVEIDTGGVQTMIGTDTTWKVHPSQLTPIGRSLPFGDYGGEQYDARLELPDWNEVEFDDSGWTQATVFAPPTSRMSAQMVQPNRIVGTINPVGVETLDDGSYLIDMGTNFTGWLEIVFPAMSPGQELRLEYADFIRENGRLDIYNQRDIYIASGKTGESFRSRFNYHAFRWVRITGLDRPPALDGIKGHMIHTDYFSAGQFACSNQLFNDIYDMTVWTYRCLTLGGYIVDCPTRERLGYGGDAGTSFETGMMNFNMAAMYSKWMENWYDAQAPDGDLPYTAPGYKDQGGGGPMWSGICITLPWQIYLQYGDSRILEESYPVMQNWLTFIHGHEADGILQPYISYGISMPQWNFLGDWIPPTRGENLSRQQNGRPDEESTLLFNNCYYVYVLDITAKIAELLGKPEEAAVYAQRADALRATLHQRFFNAETATYANGEQPYLAFPLLAGVVPQETRSDVLQSLAHDILVTRDGHLNTGMHGTYFMMKQLMEDGRDDLLFSITNQTTYPGWGYMIDHGATTIWENWLAGSHIHDTLISIGAWFNEGVGGIRWDEHAPGFRNAIIKPAVVGDLTWALTRYTSMYGDIVSDWRIEDGDLQLEVTVPPNSTADVYIPAAEEMGEILMDGQPLQNTAFVTVQQPTNGSVVASVASGTYLFTVRNYR